MAQINEEATDLRAISGNLFPDLKSEGTRCNEWDLVLVDLSVNPIFAIHHKLFKH